jgi:hypothetical protein
MNKVISITAVVAFLLFAGSASAFAAPASTAPAPANATWLNLQAMFGHVNQAQQNVIDKLEAARLQQVLALVKAGQPAEVEFAGQLAPAGARGQWTVAGLPLTWTGATVIEGTPAAGLHAHVQAQLHSDGTLEALRVHTMTRTAQAAARQHLASWTHDDRGVHLGGCDVAPGGDHTVERHAVERHAADTGHDAKDPEHVAPAGTPQPAHDANDPEHNAQPGGQQPTQPAHQATAPAPQPAHHSEGSSGGGHESGQHSGHDD